ncbi:MAG: methyltransferase domain-containing protein [Nitrospiraceae bacterium]|nr:methyltransferase domain-containing protein [Nitrospiraceae bacterium]
MTQPERQFWQQYWGGPQVTATAVTMTQILDRIKFGYLQALLPTGGRSLEVGCGSARLSCWLAQAGFRTTCLDFSTNALTSAQANYRNLRVPGSFIAAQGTELPIQDNSQDIVLSTGLLEHFPDPSPIVREMVRVLKPGGLFYSDIVPKKFSLFRSLDWVGRIKRRLGSSSEAEFYERSFTAGEIRAMLRDSGLSGVDVFPAGVVPPYLPILSRSERLRRAQVRAVGRTQRWWRACDRTWIAEWLGFYYFASAVKRS